MKAERILTTNEMPDDPTLTKRTIGSAIFSLFFGPACVTGTLVCIAYSEEIDRFIQKVLLFFWL